MSQSSPSEASRPWALYIWSGVGVLLIIGTLYLAGQHKVSAVVSDAERVDEQRGALCHEQLVGILRAVEPRELGLTSESSDRAHDLNLWQSDCGSVLVEGAVARDEALVRRLLSAETAEATLSPQYSVADVAHLRTSILMRQIADHLVEGMTDQEQVAVTLFDYVHRTVHDVELAAPAMTPYEVLLIGLGTAELRTWVFAELLRQVELDVVLIEPAEGDATGKWLIGVPVKSRDAARVLLFDTRIGLPIPAASAAEAREPFVTRAASLDEIRGDDSLLRALDAADRPYPLRSGMFQRVRVGLIGHSSVWSNRVAMLNLAVNVRGASFYSGLGENRLQSPALFERIVAAGAGGGWDEADLFAWEFPQQQLTRIGAQSTRTVDPADAAQMLLDNFRQVLAGPIIRKFTHPQTGREITWDHPLIGARHLQMTGALKDAIREYNQIRQGVNVYTPDPLNGVCLESAVYWTAACQYELEEYASVINMGFGGQYPPYFPGGPPPIWVRGMLTLSAYSMAHQGLLPQAAELLGQIPATGASQGRSYLIRRWQRLAKQSETPPSTETPPATETSPTTEAPPATEAAPERAD